MPQYSQTERTVALHGALPDDQAVLIRHKAVLKDWYRETLEARSYAQAIVSPDARAREDAALGERVQAIFDRYKSILDAENAKDHSDDPRERPSPPRPEPHPQSIAIARASEFSQKINTMHIRADPADLALWNSGAPLDEALPYLTDAERTFLVAGVTAEETHELMKGHHYDHQPQWKEDGPDFG
jgi:hypothetical protein